MDMAGVVGTNVVIQVGFIVKNLEAAAEKFTRFLGAPPMAISDLGPYEVTQTRYLGQPAPDANNRMAFFDAGNGLQIELIEPNGAKSTWQDFLDEHGEGFHHLAFGVKGMDGKVEACEAAGMKCIQRGIYGDGSGEYAYVDAWDDLKFIVELLENY